VAVRAPVELLPLVGSVPLQSPEAAHEAAFVELQLSVAALPLARLVGFAVRVTTGAGVLAVTVTDVVALPLPPAPVQVRL
jgi:hypothetical protein